MDYQAVESKGPGRPKVGEGATVKIITHVEPWMRKALRFLSAYNDVSMSEIIREAVLAKLYEEYYTDSYEELIEKINKQGVR